eukprot:6543661-Prymnesium_polylepis.1
MHALVEHAVPPPRLEVGDGGRDGGDRLLQPRGRVVLLSRAAQPDAHLDGEADDVGGELELRLTRLRGHGRVR